MSIFIVMEKQKVADLLNDSSRATIDMVAAKAVKSTQLIELIFTIACDEIPQVSPRAARVIESAYQMDAGVLERTSRDLIIALPQIKDPSIRRSILKIFLTAPLPQDETAQGILMDSAFRYLNDATEPIAVKVYSMDILYRFTAEYPEIASELMLTLEEMVRRDSAAVCVRGTYLLKQLRQGKMAGERLEN